MIIDLPWPPATGNHTTRLGKKGFYTIGSIKAYREQVGWLIRAAKLDRRLSGPLIVEWFANPPDRRAVDDDNVMKVVKDALTKAFFWQDDSNKVIRRTVFEWGDPIKGGRIKITVSTMEAA